MPKIPPKVSKIPPKVSAAQKNRGGQLCHARASPAVPTFPPRRAGAGIARIPREALPPLQLFVAEAERVFFWEDADGIKQR